MIKWMQNEPKLKNHLHRYEYAWLGMAWSVNRKRWTVQCNIAMHCSAMFINQLFKMPKLIYGMWNAGQVIKMGSKCGCYSHLFHKLSIFFNLERWWKLNERVHLNAISPIHMAMVLLCLHKHHQTFCTKSIQSNMFQVHKNGLINSKFQCRFAGKKFQAMRHETNK